MKIILITQDDPFYLAETTKDFIKRIEKSEEHKIITAIVFSPSPFGKKEKFSVKIFKIFKIFGLRFFLFYSLKYLIRKFILQKSVIKVIKKASLPLWELNSNINSIESVDRIKKLNPDIIIIIAGNQIIKKQVLDIPNYGVINAHSSLLPKYKGLMPTFWVLKNQENKTGVTVYRLTEGIDNGPIINTRTLNITPKTTQSILVRKLKYIANDLLIESLQLVKEPEKFQNNEGGSYFKFPTRKDVNEFYKNGKRFF